MNQVQDQAHSTNFASTNRTDLWWIEPLATGFGFLCFVVYTTWAMFQAGHYYAEQDYRQGSYYPYYELRCREAQFVYQCHDYEKPSEVYKCFRKLKN